MKEIKFEEALKRLEKIVGDLEEGNMSLDDSLTRYEEGIKLSRICSRQLEAAKSKVELLMKSGSKLAAITQLLPFRLSTRNSGKKNSEKF